LSFIILGKCGLFLNKNEKKCNFFLLGKNEDNKEEDFLITNA